MDRKEYLNKQMEQHRENWHTQFEEEQSKKYGESDWLDEAYKREITRFKPIIDVIDNSPNKTVTINGYKCQKSKNGYYSFGVDNDSPIRNDMDYRRFNNLFRKILFNSYRCY